MSEMLDRVVKAIEAAGNKWADEHQFDYWDEAPTEVYARAAIEAMREPTPEMLEAFIQTAAGQGVAFEEDSPAQYPQPIYRAMIDEALK